MNYMPYKKPATDKQKLAILTVIGIMYSMAVAYLFQSLPNQRYTDDLYPRLYASEKLLTTHRSLYDWKNAEELVSITHWPVIHQLGYYYPAYLMIFTAPLSQLPYGMARIIWTLFGLWSLWASTLIFAKLHKPTLSVNQLTVLLLLLTFSVPVFQHTLNAQFNTIGLLALALAYWAITKQRYFLAGLFAGGLFFKPQATIFPLLFLLGWTMFDREKRRFWVGISLAGLSLWAIGELFERGWVFHFLAALQSYTKTPSVLDKLGDPFHFFSIILAAITGWMIIHYRHTSTHSPVFWGITAWTMSLNALIIPLYGMLHMVSAGILIIALWHGYALFNRRFLPWLWYGTIVMLLLGISVFVGALIAGQTQGLQIFLGESLYKISLPIIAGLTATPLIFRGK